MEDHFSGNLIQLDENLLEFDPLAQHSSQQTDQKLSKTTSQVLTDTSYSNELLRFDDFSLNKDVTNVHDTKEIFHIGYDSSTPKDSNSLISIKHSFNNPKQQSATFHLSNSASRDISTNSHLVNIENERTFGMSSLASSSNLQNKPKSGTFLSYVTNSKVKPRQKPQSKFYDANQESKASKKSQGLFLSYVDDQPDKSTQNISRY